LNLPLKSIPSTTSTKPRPSAHTITAKKFSHDAAPAEQYVPSCVYKSYDQFVSRIKTLKPPESWQI